MTRRKLFNSLLGGLALALSLNMSKCQESSAGALLNSLRNILKQVEAALRALTALGNLLPDVVHLAADYLTRVTDFVEQSALILENEAINAAAKAQQILAMVSKIALPTISDPKVMAILQLVASAADLFLGFFGANTRSTVAATNPDVNLNDSDRRFLALIETEARVDRNDVRLWEAKATGKTVGELKQNWDWDAATPSRDEFIVSGETNVVNNTGNVSVKTTGAKRPAVVGKDNVVTYK